MAKIAAQMGGGGPTPTSITPSNSSPVALTANTPVNPTAAGYAIASYNNIIPSNYSPVTLSDGKIYLIGGGGKAVESITNLSPSNSIPKTISSGTIYKATANGEAVGSITEVAPSSTAVSVAVNDVVKITTNAGVIVDSVKAEQEKTVNGSLTSNVVVTPDSGKTLSKVSVIRPSHSTSYTPEPDFFYNDMGEAHKYRYVNTTGMVIPTGNKDLGTFTTNASITGQDVAGYATASFTINVPSSSGIPSMTLKESARWNGATASVSLTAGKYFLVMEGEGTGTPSISISGVTATNVIAVARSSGSTSRSFYAWTFTLSATKSVSVTGSGWTNRYTFTYT